MIEIVFSDSACGGLKLAQHCGKGKHNPGCTAVIFSKRDGSEPTPVELEEAQRAAEAQSRLEWEKATPMGGNPQDVFGFHLMLSVGDIAKAAFAERRQQTINALWSIYPDNPSDDTLVLTSELPATLHTICERAARGEEIRIWYSDQPDELCGLYWFMAELQPIEEQLGAVRIVRLPEHAYREDNTVVKHTSWGEVSPGQWHQYSARAERTTPVFRRHCAEQWNALQSENAALRATLNGRLVSVPEEIYDDVIVREIAAECDEFHEVRLIGRVLGKY